MENLQTNRESLIISADENLYDLSLLEELDGVDYMLEMLIILLTETPKDMKDMKDALQAGQASILCKKAHKIKSSAAIIQATTLMELLADIEIYGKKEVIGNEMKCMVENASVLFSNIETALKIDIEKLRR